MHTMAIARGVHWVAIPEADLFILCGCPADSVKLLMKKGLILPTQKNGVSCETGPNAILLSDVPSQNETFSNLAEFPILQMLYRQGMIIPGHPGNTGRKPLLMGLESQVRSQSQYMIRGNYGLSSEEEIVAAGVPRETARDYMRMKLWFAFGHIRAAEELVETRILGGDAVELRGGATVRRTGFNAYEFAFNGQTAAVDMNLAPGERYPSSYSLGYHRIRREYFSVVHIGEGDGWDTEKPCMGSIITFQGRIYLIDAGPNIEQSLTAVGINVNEIEGIFHSHSHDDHFAGLTALVRSDHRIKYFATPLVRASVAKKLSALMGMDEAMFPRYFEVHDLAAGKWNDVNGLHVKPVISAHPVETNLFFFRTLWDGGYKTYAHLADIVGVDVLRRMSAAAPTAPGVSKEFAEKLIAEMRTPADLKKIDADGEPIHGVASDFRADTSGRLIISHLGGELSDEQKEIGSNAVFGREDVLIPANVDYIAQSAFRFLRSYFPQVAPHSVRMLANCPLVYFNAGSIIMKKGERPELRVAHPPGGRGDHRRERGIPPLSLCRVVCRRAFRPYGGARNPDHPRGELRHGGADSRAALPGIHPGEQAGGVHPDGHRQQKVSQRHVAFRRDAGLPGGARHRGGHGAAAREGGGGSGSRRCIAPLPRFLGAVRAPEGRPDVGDAEPRRFLGRG